MSAEEGRGRGRSCDCEDSPVVLIGVQRLVAGSVALDSLLEIQHGVRLVAVAVVRT